jgi:hypothetical protein
MSAFGGKADITIAACPLFRSLLGVKQTCFVAPHMSANDPKRTSGHERECALQRFGGGVMLPVVGKHLRFHCVI